MDEHIRILLIEDSIGFGRLIRELLVESAFDSDLQVASSMKEGLEVLVDGNFETIISFKIVKKLIMFINILS